MTYQSSATTNLIDAIQKCSKAIDRHIGSYIEIGENKNAEQPVRIVNPELDDPFNWYSGMAYKRSSNAEPRFLNTTHEDLHHNWFSAFGTKQAVEAYQRDGTMLDGLIENGGISHPLPFSVGVEYGINEEYLQGWNRIWEPKKGIKRYIIDPKIDKVYIVVNGDDRIGTKQQSLQRLAKFIADNANNLELSRGK